MRRLILLLLFPVITLAQVKATIKDSLTGKPIPYCAITSNDSEFGVSSDINGEFHVPDYDSSKTLLFDAVGYKSKTIASLPKNRQIVLQKKNVVPHANVDYRRTETSKSGEIPNDYYDVTKTSNFFTKPAIMAKYFPYKSKYEDTPYLNTVKVNVISKISDAVYKLRIFNVGPDGKPGNDVLTEDFIITAQKGDKIQEIDVTSRNIVFDKAGFFIGVETVIVDENLARVPWLADVRDKESEITREIYQPTFRGNSIGNGTLWRHMNNKWVNLTEKIKYKKSRSTRYSVNNLFMEIELTN